MSGGNEILRKDYLCLNIEKSRFIVDHRLNAKPDVMSNTKEKKD